MYSFPYLEPVYCSKSCSNCFFLTCIQISQKAGKMVWYPYLLKNFPQFAVIHTVKGFSVVSEVGIDSFLEFPCFFYYPADVGNLISGSFAFLFPACTSSSLAFLMMYSACKLDKQGDNIQPWTTPFPIWNQSVVPCLVLTVASWPAYRFLRRQVRWSCILISSRIFHSLLWSTQSKNLA